MLSRAQLHPSTVRAIWTGAERKFSGSSEVSSSNGLPHFAVTEVSILGVPDGESVAGEHFEVDPRSDEQDFVTANFGEHLFPALR
jgi:hypothetical protein